MTLAHEIARQTNSKRVRIYNSAQFMRYAYTKLFMPICLSTTNLIESACVGWILLFRLVNKFSFFPNIYGYIPIYLFHLRKCYRFICITLNGNYDGKMYWNSPKTKMSRFVCRNVCKCSYSGQKWNRTYEGEKVFF